MKLIFDLYYLTGKDFSTLTTCSMEAMIIVGLCLGSFVKGPGHDMSFPRFIDHINVIRKFVLGRRKAMDLVAKSSLRDQSRIYLSNWNIKDKTYNVER